MLTLTDPSALIPLSVALGIGLLVGTERERHKGSGPHRRSAGIRTFTVCTLAGFVAQSLGGTPLLITALLLVGVLSGLSYQRSKEHDPGLTSEVTILLSCLLGGLSVQSPELAALIGIVLTALLAARGAVGPEQARALTLAGGTLSATSTFFGRPGSTSSITLACMASTMAAARRMKVTSLSDFTMRCQLTRPVASEKRAALRRLRSVSLAAAENQ